MNVQLSISTVLILILCGSSLGFPTTLVKKENTPGVPIQPGDPGVPIQPKCGNKC